MGTEWTARDAVDFEGRGWAVDEANAQLAQLESGGVAVTVDRPCVAGDGIQILTDENRSAAAKAGRILLEQSGACVNFVPASGAASRMFAALKGDWNPALQKKLQERILEFPFWSACQRQALEALPLTERVTEGIRWMLDPESGWSGLPKGLIPFHRYEDGSMRSSFEEHVAEWTMLAGDAPMHFTIPARFVERIEALWKGKEHISSSVQLPMTDTLAWDVESNQIARHESGTLLFRPGGHGALLSNLNALPGAFVTIRNVDNVVPRHRMPFRNAEQRILLGQCAMLATERDALLEQAEPDSEMWKTAAANWLKGFDEHAGEITDGTVLLHQLNRPIRVAGMVVNEGAPGGGPFWIRQSDGRVTPSIVEGSELPEGGLSGGTHFNPVDLVCNVRRRDGFRYDLMSFAQTDRFYTGQKDWEGRKLRILERPGLWNGGMDGWLTRFVEVPAETFFPVKTVMDLLDVQRMPSNSKA